MAIYPEPGSSLSTGVVTKIKNKIPALVKLFVRKKQKCPNKQTNKNNAMYQQTVCEYFQLDNFNWVVGWVLEKASRRK